MAEQKPMTRDDLIIYLHADALSTPSWMILNAVGDCIQTVIKGSSEKLANLAKDKKVSVIVPGEDILLINVTMPALSSARLKQAIPYAIEDQIIAELDSIHIAYGEITKNAPVPLAIVCKNLLQDWLNLLKQWQVIPHVLLPAQLALPYQEQHWHIHIHDHAIVRTQENQGFTCEVSHLNDWLTHALQADAGKPHKIYVHRTEQTEHNLFNQEHMSNLPPMVTKLTTWQQLLRSAANAVQGRNAINLLQGPYKVSAKSTQGEQHLKRISKTLLIALICSLMIYPTVAYFLLKSSTNTTEQKIAMIYKHYFPHATAMVTPKKRVQEKLNQQLKMDSTLLNLLTKVAEFIQNHSGIVLHRINYQYNKLTIDITTKDSQLLTELSTYLSKQGLQVVQQNSSLAGLQVHTSLVIS